MKEDLITLLKIARLYDLKYYEYDLDYGKPYFICE